MNHKGAECICRTFNYCFFPFYQIQHIDTVSGLMGNCRREPMTAGFNKLIFVKPRTFFHPSYSLCNSLNLSY